MKAVELAIVGGGPAALAAAAEAARAGLQSISIVDDNRTLGGQYYRQPPKAFRVREPSLLGHDYVRGQALVEGAQTQAIHVERDATVWGILPEENALSLATGEGCWSLKAKAFLLATGAYDRPVAFPGWTLPGVMTAGAAQMMLKAYRILPGRRVLVVGSGPLLLALTKELLDAGAEVVAVAEASRVQPWLKQIRHGPALLGDWQTLVDGLGYLRTMRAAGVPYLPAHTIVAAHGQNLVEEAVVAKLDEESRPIAGTERRWRVDTICLGFGFIPSMELARACGCALEYLPQWGYFAPRIDRWMESSMANVFIAGDAAGIRGVKIAEEQGKLAALAVAHRLGYIDGQQLHSLEREPRTRLARLQRFRAAIDSVFSCDGRLQQNLITPDTIVCRCEGTTARQVYDAIADGAVNPYGVKIRSQAGQGPCQGRNCSPVIARLIAERTGREPGEVEPFSLRPPIRPVPMGVLAGCQVSNPVKP